LTRRRKEEKKKRKKMNMNMKTSLLLIGGCSKAMTVTKEEAFCSFVFFN